MNKDYEIVSLEYRVYQSFKGRYFIGHTPTLQLTNRSNAWGGLFNPSNSPINLYFNTFTVTNYSSIPFSAKLWLNTSPIGNTMTSCNVSPANTAFCPLPEPESYLLYAQNVNCLPNDGVSIFTRIAEAISTVVGNYYGKIIIPPGGSIITYLQSTDSQLINAEVAFGWWEEKK